MPKKRSEKRDLAFKLWKKAAGNIKLKDLALEIGVSESLVRKWKNQDNWNGNITKQTNGNITKQKKQTKEKKKKIDLDVFEDVEKNGDLNEKQKLFCIYYLRYFNATKAYMKAYGCNYESAHSAGCRMLANVSIKNEIQRLKKEKLNREFLSEEDIFQRYIDIAFADITDFIEFGQEEAPVVGMYGPVMVKDEDGKKTPLLQNQSYVRLKDSLEVDGTIISEVRNGRDGAFIKLGDRMKALQWLTDHMDMATEEQKARIESMRAKTSTNGQTAEDKVMKLFEAIGGELDAE